MIITISSCKNTGKLVEPFKNVVYMDSFPYWSSVLNDLESWSTLGRLTKDFTNLVSVTDGDAWVRDHDC